MGDMSFFYSKTVRSCSNFGLAENKRGKKKKKKKKKTHLRFSKTKVVQNITLCRDPPEVNGEEHCILALPRGIGRAGGLQLWDGSPAHCRGKGGKGEGSRTSPPVAPSCQFKEDVPCSISHTREVARCLTSYLLFSV